MSREHAIGMVVDEINRAEEKEVEAPAGDGAPPPIDEDIPF